MFSRRAARTSIRNPNTRILRAKKWPNISKTSINATPISANASSSCVAIFDVASARTQLAALEQKTSAPDFWQNQEKAQALLQERKQLEDRVNAANSLESKTSDIETYFHLAQEESDDAQRDAVLADIDKELAAVDAYVSDLETKTLLAGETDRLNAILTIKPGAGGTESQDWAEMLLRMYLRWAEEKGFRATILDSTPGEEAGIKSATVQIEGENAYGMLAGESGVHRLVRISPFDQAARRHTSFASAFVIPEIDDRIDIVVRPEELRIDTFRAGGHGGQNVNKVESAVRITHLPTGTVVQCQNERSQHKNREIAMKVLRSQLYEQEIEKRRAAMRKLDASKPEISFGSQIRSYVMQPYQLIKDHRTKVERGDVQKVLDGDLDPFIRAYLLYRRDAA
ncbi:MAG TPA: peptide chain release factor 2 [Candidatus Acidoferrales bacterium]|nr:peptide chain release factor 2 [Candidatus Acidoferrales bacterium]